VKGKFNIPRICLCILIVTGCRAGAEASATAATWAPQGIGLATAAIEAHYQPAPEPPNSLTRASAARMATAELAELLFGPGAATQMTHHELADPIFPGGPLRGIRFFAHPQPLGKDLCRRDNFYVSLGSPSIRSAQNTREDLPVTKEQVMESLQIAFAPGCRLKPDGFFAHVQDAASVEAATALRRLTAIQQRAKSAEPLPLELRCTSELAENPCGAGARAVLARLPLHQIFIIQSLDRDGDETTKGWKFSVMPEGPGNKPFWKVVLDDTSGRQPTIRMAWDIPAPF
jgi:hypothetical protein